VPRREGRCGVAFKVSVLACDGREGLSLRLNGSRIPDELDCESAGGGGLVPLFEVGEF
jgi:hypothetical protein